MKHRDTGSRQGKSLADRTPLSAIMTTDVVCAREEMDICELSRTFLDLGFSGSPVVDDQGRAIGVVSKTDLVRHAFAQWCRHKQASKLELCEEPPREKADAPCPKVRDIMTPIAYSLTPDVSIARAAALMAFEGIHRLPIIEKPGGKLVGLLASVDVLRWMGEQSGYLRQTTQGNDAAVA